MIELNTKQVLQVEHLLVKKGISSNHLLTDLIDHVCCAIEKKLEYGREFDVALNEVLNDFGESGLLEIQNETTYLTNLNLQKMRQITYIAGLVAMGLILTGSVFKVMHWPGASIMFVLGYGTLCLIFLPLFFIDKSKIEISNIGKAAQMFGFLGSATLLSAILFKVMHWPGTNMLAIGGLFTLCFVYLPMMLYKNRLDKASPENNRYLILGFSLLFGTFILMIYLKPSNVVHKAPFNIEVSLLQSRSILENQLSENGIVVSDSVDKNQQKNEQIRQLCKDQLAWVAAIKLQIVEAANGEKVEDLTYESINNPEKLGVESSSEVWTKDGYNYQQKMQEFQAQFESISGQKFDPLVGNENEWMPNTFKGMAVGVAYLYITAHENQILAMELKALSSN